MRNEIKYEINQTEYKTLKTNLEKIIKKDIHLKNREKYNVKTIYFDNIYDEILQEKIDGTNYREKFRIRMYDNKVESIYLEKKIRNNNKVIKYKEPITYEEVKQIISGEYEFLLGKSKLKTELYINIKTRLLKPKTIIMYERIAYEDEITNTRITIDTNICKEDNIKNFWEAKIKSNNKYILEIKYNKIIPKIIAETLKITTQRQGISKYKKMRLNRCKLN